MIAPPAGKPFRWIYAILLIALVGVGCASGPKPVAPPGTQGIKYPERLQPLADRLEQEGERNWVLNLNELAVAAMRMGEREIAKNALDEAMLNINAVFGTTPEAAQARSVFFSEDVKLFKGDPYERSMTFFYRGVLYMQDGDWENARACFRSANLQDAFAEEEQNRADWAMFDYLIAVCEIQLDRPVQAQEAFDRALKNYEEFALNYGKLRSAVVPRHFPDLIFPKPEHNLLIITQTGPAPRKIAVGRYDQYIQVRRGYRGWSDADIEVCGIEKRNVEMMDSVYYQAATRGGRPFDAIQKRKVIFKDVTGTIGDIGLIGGGVVLLQGGSEAEMGLGLGLLAVGLIAHGASLLTKPQADIRQWQSLPDAIGATIGKACSGEQELSVQFATRNGVTSKIDVPEPGRGLAVVLAFPPPRPSLLSNE